MLDETLFEQLHNEQLISDTSFEKIKAQQGNSLLSVYHEIRTLLYLGVLLLTSGLGILIYKNIDSISHQALLIFIAAVSASAFYYCFKNKLPFSLQKVNAPNSFFDYILLLACLCFVILISYWQYQFHIFGDRFGLVTFIPMIVLFFCAYFFDHLGILSLAITNLAAWVGIAVTPTQILKANDFNSSTIIIMAFLLGILLILAGRLTIARHIKSHFEFTYTNFGLHIVFISCLAGLFHFDAVYLLWFLALLGIAFYFYREVLQKKSFYFLVVLTLYTYAGLNYVIVHSSLSILNSDLGAVSLLFLYFIGSSIGLIIFLIRMNKKLKAI